MKDYTFDGYIRKEVLENYLSRAATAAFWIHTETLEDDLRAIKNLGIKFLGRASGIWEPEASDEEHFKRSRYIAGRAHEADPDIILQACVFEIVYKYEENYKIPAYVFKAFGLPVEDRGFCFEKMCFPDKPRAYYFGESAIPDITQLETRLWFYYRATEYIDAGYEALHLGQIHLYTANDKGFKEMWKLVEMIRSYAREHARRHYVLLDAHSHGISKEGKLLLDYHAMPFTRVPLSDRVGEKLVLVREGFSEGGISPSGWYADAMPYLMEYDNWGGKVIENFSDYTYEERAYLDWWGYDQIGWFANQDEEGQRHFLEYTYKWTAINNVNAYFEIPFRRSLDAAAVEVIRKDNGSTALQNFYQINTKSRECPMGFNQEETIKRLWNTEDIVRKMAANPWNLLDYGARNIYDSETGMKLPEKVVVYGSFQPMVGAVKNDSNSEVTRMYYISKNTYTLSVIIPYSGEYDYAVSTYGTLSATYCYDRYPRSGSSNKDTFFTSRDNTIVRFQYEFIENKVTIEIFEEEEGCVTL